MPTEDKLIGYFLSLSPAYLLREFDNEGIQQGKRSRPQQQIIKINSVCCFNTIQSVL